MIPPGYTHAFDVLIVPAFAVVGAALAVAVCLKATLAALVWLTSALGPHSALAPDPEPPGPARLVR